jgi:hypothetical protein
MTPSLSIPTNIRRLTAGCGNRFRSADAGHRRGFSILEVLILCAVAATALVLLSPVVHRLRSSSGEAVSMMNLMNIGGTHSMYAADWNDRQYTCVPDDLGVYSTSSLAPALCTAYVDAVDCYPSQLLGTMNGAGFYSYIAPCPPGAIGQSCSMTGYGWPFSFVPAQAAFPGVATFRFLNLSALNAYANGRWYDELYYSPTDVKAYAAAQPNFDSPSHSPSQMAGSPNPPVWSSYCSSPAAMFHPNVLTPATRRGPAWQFTFADRFKSPTASQCLFPDLKTQLIEHNWNQNPPAEANPAVSGGNTPYQFNHGLDSSPMTLFFDGHAAMLSMAAAVADDVTVKRQTRSINGLWSRNSPLGESGYFGDLSFDGTKSGLHILTLGGIVGRDVLTAP